MTTKNASPVESTATPSKGRADKRARFAPEDKKQHRGASPLVLVGGILIVLFLIGGVVLVLPRLSPRPLPAKQVAQSILRQQPGPPQLLLPRLRTLPPVRTLALLRPPPRAMTLILWQPPQTALCAYPCPPLTITRPISTPTWSTVALSSSLSSRARME